MRSSITLFDDQYQFYKELKSEKLLTAFVEYMFENIEPEWLNSLEQTIFNSLRIRMDNQKQKANAWAKWWRKSRWWWRPKKQAEKQAEKQTKKQAKNKEEEVEEEVIKENKENVFETFWKEYPHERPWKKKESKQYFLKQNTDEVMQQVRLYKWQILSWLKPKQYVPACQRWIRDFTPIRDIMWELKQIVKWHLKTEWDKHERFEQLKQDFPDVDFNELTKDANRDRWLIKMNFN